MNPSFKVSLKDKTISKIVRACYPDYRGRKVSVESATKYRMENYWDGGSRSYVKAYHLESGRVMPADERTSNPHRQMAHSEVAIPEGVALIEHTIFQGKDVGIRIFVNPANMVKFLPAA